MNGFTSLNLTKLDVLDDLDEIKVGVRYMYDGKELDSMPSNLQVRTYTCRCPQRCCPPPMTHLIPTATALPLLQVLSELVVEYETVPGWKQSLAQCRNFEDLPPAAQVRACVDGELWACGHMFLLP